MSRLFADLGRYHIKYILEGKCESVLEPQSYCTEIRGTIYKHIADGDDIVAGRISGKILHVQAMRNDRAWIFDVLDNVSGEIEQYHDAFFSDDHQDYREELDLESFGPDLLVLERMEILPAHRRRRLGLLVMRDVMSRYGSTCAAIAIHPFPLQHSECFVKRDLEAPPESRMGYGDMSRDFEVSTKKLVDYYSRLGFRPVPGHDKFMYSDPAFVLADTRKLLRPTGKGNKTVGVKA